MVLHDGDGPPDLRTEGSHLRWSAKWPVATNRKTSEGGVGVLTSCRRTGPPLLRWTDQPAVRGLCSPGVELRAAALARAKERWTSRSWLSK